MMMLLKLAKILICIIAVTLLVIIQNVLNAKKNRRVRQILLPFIAAFWGVVSVIIGYNLFDKIGVWIKNISFLINIDVALLNIATILCFVIIKAIIRPIITSLWKKKKLIEATGGMFYTYDDDYEEWFLPHRWMNFRKFFFAIVCGATLAAGLYIGVIWAYGIDSPVWCLAFPCAALITINEIYNFINGQTKEEFEHSILGEDADARRVSNFYRVREILENILPEPLLASHTGFEFAGKETPADLIKKLKESEDRIDVITGEYFDVLERYSVADTDCVNGTLQMMHRKNVVYLNPFYRDLSLYITLPLVNCLLSGKKCVAITGRMSNSSDVEEWLSNTLSKYSHMKSLWRVKKLTEKEPDCDVGVINFSQLYDRRVISSNRCFFNETDFVLLIEPSMIVNTGQVALSIIAQEMHCGDEMPAYCVCDRNVDGLVDTLSHLLHSEFTNVIAPPVPRCIYTGMGWNADGDFIRQQLFDKQTRFLGNGIELAAIAVKNQIPSVSWYSETKAPIRDIQWIAGQYHTSICRYMNLPAQQKTLYEKIKFIPNLWSTPKQREQFIIAEDEFCNMFSTLRAYLSRGIAQSFVNVMSENYLLRDYMRCNKQMFLSNPNAIPSIVPDYAKTERNTLIKLLLQMTYRQVLDSEIIDEFHLVGVETTDAFETLTKMLKKYTYADNTIFTIHTTHLEVDELTTRSAYQYSIANELFDELFAESLKNAYFILEDEKHEEDYIDAKLFGHVTQIVLPGQFVTYDGKYYIAKHVSPQSGVVLRRASDLYDGRKYYRQVREYIFDQPSEEKVLSLRSVMDIEIAYIQADFCVNTTGYLEMRDNHDLRLARLIDFAGDPTINQYSRKYHNKTVLRIKLPDTTDKIRFTICLLLSEVFKSVFPDGWPYLAVVAKRPDDIEGILNYLVYPVKGGLSDDCIYIIEDSEIDLGLTEAVDRNLMKLMEIVADFLDWHYEKIREPASKDPVPVSINYSEEKEKKKKRNLFVRMAQRISRLFGGKKEKEIKIESPDKIEAKSDESTGENPNTAIESAPQSAETLEEEYSLDSNEHEEEGTKTKTIETTQNYDNDDSSEIDNDGSRESQSEKVNTSSIAPANDIIEDDELVEPEGDPEIVDIDGTDIFDNEGMPDDADLEDALMQAGVVPVTQTRYQRECFLKFGYEEIDGRLQIEEVRKYLRVRGWSNNSLTKARKRDVLVRTNLDLNAENHCDFCSLPLSGVSYEVLNDGRTRCNDCSSSAISSVEDFRKLFYQVLEMMEAFYGVKYKIPICVAMADARVVAKGAGSIFRPSTEVANRVLGFAQRKHGKYSLLIENGSPRLATIDTMVHEMTHIWQYLNWNDNQIVGIYRMNHPACTAKARDIVYEGMAMWASIQYLYQIGETYYAAQQEAIAMARQDIYGIGYRLYADQYPIIKDSSLIRYSPFNSFPTIEPQKVWDKVKEQCTEKECRC